MEKVTALVLAGGKASRMQHAEKALLDLCGQNFLQRILSQLAQFDQLLLSADNSGRYPPIPGVELVTDIYPGTGPLGGLYTGLIHAQNPLVLIVPCDTPLITTAFCSWLCEQVTEDWDAALPETPDGIHPIPGAYRKSCAEIVRSQIESGDYGIRRLRNSLRVRQVDTVEAGFRDVLTNINTKEQYESLLASLE